MAKPVTQHDSVDSVWPRAIGVLVVLATLWYLPWALPSVCPCLIKKSFTPINYLNESLF